MAAPITSSARLLFFAPRDPVGWNIGDPGNHIIFIGFMGLRLGKTQNKGCIVCTPYNKLKDKLASDAGRSGNWGCIRSRGRKHGNSRT